MASKKKLKKRVKKLENHIEQLTGQKPLSKEERDEIFYKYSFDYNDEPDVDKRNVAVLRQRFMYDKLYEKSLDNTAIERLLDMTLEDIERFHTMKSGIENKCGFILALWGILVAILFDSDNNLLSTIKGTIYDGKYTSVYFWITFFLAMALLVVGIFDLVFIYRTLKKRKYTKFVFEDKDENLRGAVTDKNIMYVVFIDNVTQSWGETRTAVDDMANYYHKALIGVIVFATIIVLSFIILV